MIRYNERVFIAGPTGSGKSTVANAFAAELRCQVLHYDTKDEWAVRAHEGDGDVPAATNVHRIDPRLPVMHFQGNGGPEEAQEVFTWAWAHPRPLVVVVHELADLCDDQPARTPPAFRGYVRKGRAHGKGLIGATQRPVGMPRIARTEAQHIVLPMPRLDPEDEAIVLKMCEGAGRTESGESRVAVALAQAEQLGPHAFVWYDKNTREVVVSPPMPRHLLARGPVRSTTLA